jgi:hypothetical protein
MAEASGPMLVILPPPFWPFTPVSCLPLRLHLLRFLRLESRLLVEECGGLPRSVERSIASDGVGATVAACAIAGILTLGL